MVFASITSYKEEMRNYSTNIDKIYQNISRNAKNSNPMKCYSVCANKEKLEILKRLEPQIIYGRRGTGKTTLLKSFCYLINDIEKEKPLTVAWYVSLEDCVPTMFSNTENEDILVLTIRNFIKKLSNFFFKRLEDFEKSINIQKRFGLTDNSERSSRVNKIINYLSDLEVLVNQGSPEFQFYTGIQRVEVGNGKKFGGILSVVPANMKIEVSADAEAYGERKTENKMEKPLKYCLDFSQIRDKISQIIDAFSYQHLFICIDEFYQIDKELNYSIQSSFAQVIKMILFSNEKIVVKVANVWNESKIQSKQFGGKREGLELGHDIFESKELDLDTMFECDNEKAYYFFTTMLINYSRLDDCQILKEKYSPSTMKNIVDSMFGKDALTFLICGSQGIPRIFGQIFAQCVEILRKTNDTILTSNIICQGIIENYNVNVRASIPYNHPLCMMIDEYVSRTQNRFFLVTDGHYNLGINFFDGLVAKAALHQYPSSRVPRKLRNRYKVFFVHYGNFLEAIEPDPLKSITLEGKINDNKLYPQFPEDLEKNIKKFLLEVEDDMFNINYCDNCHTLYTFQGSNYACPTCGKLSRFWNRLI